MKEYRICTIQDKAGLDALPVAKIVDYPMEERDYRPFAQNILCREQGDGKFSLSGYRLRMWAFEVSPPEDSELRAVLGFFTGGAVLEARIWINDEICHEVTLYSNGKEETVRGYEFRNYSGEDLQGVYWGGEFFFADEVLKELAGPVLAKPGQEFAGNFYKICPDRHYGSFSAVDWDDPYSMVNMGRFAVVGY